jgi:hypothetical protein
MVDAGVEPPIINDNEHQDFFFAIVKNRNGAVPEIKPEELAAWRSKLCLVWCRRTQMAGTCSHA